MTAKEKLCALADAIREKTGETGLLTLDKMTELVSALGAGSEIVLPEGWAMGEFNTTEETAQGDFPIAHGLSDIPNYIFIWSTAPTYTHGSWRMLMKVNLGKTYNEETKRYEPTDIFSYGVRETTTAFRASTCSESDVDDTDYFMVPSQTSSVYPPDITYKWVAIHCSSE